MGAHLNVMTPVTIQISKSVEKDAPLANPEEFLPVKYREHFRLVSSEQKEKKIAIGSFKMTSYKHEAQFELIENVHGQIKEFLPLFWNEMAKPFAGVRSPIIEIETLTPFLENDFTTLDLSRENLDNLDDQLSRIYSNYFLRIYGLPNQVVYSGFPIEIDENTSAVIECFSILQFWEKYGIEREAEDAFSRQVESVIQELTAKYAVGKHVFMAAF